MDHFLSPQVKAEFKRIVTTDLLETFLSRLDDLVQRLLELHEAGTKSGKKQSLKELLDCLTKDVSESVDDRKLAIICSVF